MKQFFKMMFASAMGVLVAMGLLIVIGIYLMFGAIQNMSGTTSYSPSANTVLKISLSGQVKDNKIDNPWDQLFGEGQSVLSLKDIIYSIEAAKENSNITGIYLEAGSLFAGTASIEAIRRALVDFKESGKFVVAYGDSYTQGAYFLSSAADQVYMNPQGTLALVGMASQGMFYKNLLNKLGIDMMVFKVGTYKGAVEPFMLDKYSDENREQIQSYISSIWNNVAKGISNSRDLSVERVESFTNEGLAFASPEKAIEYGLVDELKYKAEVDELVKDLAQQEGKKLQTVGVSKAKLLKLPSTNTKAKNKIAVMYAEGEIMPATPSSPYYTEQTITEKVAEELRKLKSEDDIKAVVLRVNSPGGSAYVSEQIWREVVELKKTKPVVVSMGNVAASGGYYISCAANKIVAEENTLTGSIGIFGMFPNLTGLFEKISLTTDIVKTNTYADMGDVSRPMREDEKALIQAFVERGYDTFITRCSDGRSLSKQEIDAVGQGRVWTGKQAQERGLVDEIGGLDKAIEVAAELAEITDYQTVAHSAATDFFTDFLEKQLDEIKTSALRGFLGTEYEYYKRINVIKSASGIQARLPYDMNPL